MTLNAYTYKEQASRLMLALSDEGVSAHEFGALLWALVWWRVQAADAEPAASQAADAVLEQVSTALRAVALRIWQALLSCEEPDGLGEAYRALCRIEALNSQLLAEPSSFGLPADLDLPACVRPLEPAQLREWLAAIAIWQRAALAEQPARPADTVSRAQLTDAIVRLRELADTSRRLQHPVLPSLFGGETGDGARLKALQHAAASYIELADGLRKILPAQAQQNPIAALFELDRKLDQARLVQPHWLTDRMYATITSHARAFESQLNQEIGALVAELLGTADQDLGAQRLYQEVLLPCATLSLADAVEAALRPYLQSAAADAKARRRADRPDPRLAQLRIILLALSKLVGVGRAPRDGGV